MSRRKRPEPNIPDYRKLCRHWHEDLHSLLRCHWPTVDITGSGSFATIITCGKDVKVRLYRNAEEAAAAWFALNCWTCGPDCRRPSRFGRRGNSQDRHKVVRLPRHIRAQPTPAHTPGPYA